MSGGTTGKATIQAAQPTPPDAKAPATGKRLSRDAQEWIVLGALFLGVFGLLALLSGDASGIKWRYLLSVFIIVVIYAVFALGLSLEFGYTGLVNFGHVAFMGVAAYTSAIFFMRTQARLAPALEGASAPGFLITLGLGALLGVVFSVPLFLLRNRFAPNVAPKLKMAAAFGAAAAVTALTVYACYPLTPAGAVDAVAWLGVVLGICASAFVGLLLGLPTVRLREDYLAIVTIGAAEILRSFWMNEEWLTRGTLGVLRLERPPLEFALASPWWDDLAGRLDVLPVPLMTAALGVLVLAFTFLLLQLLARSPWGRVLKAIREDEEVAQAVGKNAFWFKLQSLMIGSAVAGAAGILFVWNLTNIFPEHFIPLITFYAFIIVVVGGIGNHKGALAGAIILWGIFELARNLKGIPGLSNLNTAGPPQAIFIGALLILVMMFRPQGLLGRKEELVFAK